MNASDKFNEKLQEEMRQLRERNKKTENELDAPIAVLKNEASYLKLAVYILGFGLLVIIGAGWQLYLHLDEEIEHKVDYINERIDTLFLTKGTNTQINPNVSGASSKK